MITKDLINDVIKYMSTGKSLVQVAAKLKMSKKQFNNLLTSNKEDLQMQADLRDAIEFGATLHEAHYESLFTDAMAGKIEGCKEGLIKAYMQNKFKWADKTENKQKEDTIAELSDDELLERINNAKS